MWVRSLARVASRSSRPSAAGLPSLSCLDSACGESASASPASTSARWPANPPPRRATRSRRAGAPVSASSIRVSSPATRSTWVPAWVLRAHSPASASSLRARSGRPLMICLRACARWASTRRSRTSLLILSRASIWRAKPAAFLNEPAVMAVSKEASRTCMSWGQRSRACSRRRRTSLGCLVCR